MAAVRLDLFAETQRRLEAEAARRGLDLGELIAQIVMTLPDPGSEPAAAGRPGETPNAQRPQYCACRGG